MLSQPGQHLLQRTYEGCSSPTNFQEGNRGVESRRSLDQASGLKGTLIKTQADFPREGGPVRELVRSAPKAAITADSAFGAQSP